MKSFDLTRAGKSATGEDTLSRAARRAWESEEGSVPVVDAQGRMTGLLITSRDVCLAWRASRGVLSRGVIRIVSLRSPRHLELVANDVSVYFLGENGVVQRMQEDRDDDPPLSLDRSPMLGPGDLGAFMAHALTTEGYARRERSEGFADHYRLATLFWTSLSVREREHLVLCARCELGKVESKEAWRRAIAQFRRVDGELARRVAKGLRHSGAEGESVIELLVPRR